MILPTNCLQSWDLILFCHWFRSRTVASMWDLQYSPWNLDCCWNLSHEYCRFHCYRHKHSQITECCSPSPATLEVLFCFFRTSSFTPFTNHLDSNDNSKSVLSPLRGNWSYQVGPDLSRIPFGVGWVGWKNVVCLAISPSGCRATSEPNCRGDMYTSSYDISPVISLTTSGMEEAGSVSWKMIAFDWVWSNVNYFSIERLCWPNKRRLESRPCIVQVLCTTWCIQVNLIRIHLTFCP